MKRFLIIPFLACALAVSGCSSNVGNFLTASITNPVSSVDMYRVKNVYAATLQLAVDYRNYCWSKTYAAIMADPISKPVCEKRRAIVRYAQAAQLKAGSAIRSADNFVLNNPTINATNVVAAAWQAVTDFQAAVPRVN